jgi:F-type H+-transporting ATPase subunit gamma
MAGGLKEVRERIGSVQNTMQITSAMKMVSVAKLRRAQEAITRMRPYAEKLQAILSNASASMEEGGSVYATRRSAKRILLVVVTSNRGLCGGFNNNAIKEANLAMRRDGVAFEVLPLGKKAHDAFRRREELKPQGFPADAWQIFDHLSFGAIQDLGEVILRRFAAGELDEVRLIYNRFVNAAVQIPTNEQLLPMEPKQEGEGKQTLIPTGVEYIFEPSREEIVERIIPNALMVQFYKAVLDSHASEHGARMTAMHQATENAGDLLRDLRISYNKARQAAITTEILEIVAGSEALEG